MKRQKNKKQQTDFTDKTKSFHAFPPHFQRRSHGKHKKLTFPSIRYKLPGFMTIFAKSEQASNAFTDVKDDDDREFLQFFSLVCLLSFDVYMKKNMIESLIDEVLSGTRF